MRAAVLGLLTASMLGYPAIHYARVIVMSVGCSASPTVIDLGSD